jgi:hypothetical protein
MPEQVYSFVINSQEKISGKNNSQNVEKSELLELRKEVAKLKRKVCD